MVSHVGRFQAPRGGELTRAMQEAWRRDGALVLEGFATERQCRELRARMDALIEASQPGADARLSIFTTRDEDQRDAAFLASAGEVAFFFEEEAVDDQGRLRCPTREALNKVGHALHDRDPVFSRFSRRPELAEVARGVGFHTPRLVQSMYIFKNPRRGGEVGWHQDGAFLRTEPLSVVGFWFALDDATTENGCLQVLPGLHREPLRSRFWRDGERVDLEVLDPTPWPEERAVALEAPRGTLIVLHGALPHASAANRSGRSRAAYTLHVVDGAARYCEDNWLRRDDPFRGFAPGG